MEQILLYGHRKPLQDSRKCQMTRTLKGGHYYALLSLSLFFSDHSFICICLSTSPLYFFSHCQAVCLPPQSLPPFPLLSLPLIHSFIHICHCPSFPPFFFLPFFPLSSVLWSDSWSPVISLHVVHYSLGPVFMCLPTLASTVCCQEAS